MFYSAGPEGLFSFHVLFRWNKVQDQLMCNGVDRQGLCDVLGNYQHQVLISFLPKISGLFCNRSRRCDDRMVVVFRITYAISAYHQ